MNWDLVRVVISHQILNVISEYIFPRKFYLNIHKHQWFEPGLGHVGKPSSAYGWSGGFCPSSPVFAHL